jgi:hypothetical protein
VLIVTYASASYIVASTNSVHLPLLDPNEVVYFHRTLLFHCYEQPRPQHLIQLPPPRMRDIKTKSAVGLLVLLIQESDALHMLLDRATSLQHAPGRRTPTSHRSIRAFS